LAVTQVTSSSALFQWEHVELGNIHDVQFKVECNGILQYFTLERESVQEKIHFSHVSYSTSGGKEYFRAENMSSNTKYTCFVSTLAGSIQSPPSQTVQFSTKFGGELSIGEKIKQGHHPLHYMYTVFT